MAGNGGDLIDLSAEPSSSSSTVQHQRRGSKDIDPLILNRTATRESVRSGGSGGSGETGTSGVGGGLSNLLSNTVSLFSRKRGSISAPDSHPSNNVPDSNSSTSESGALNATSGQAPAQSLPAIQTGVPFNFGGMSASTSGASDGLSPAAPRPGAYSSAGRGSSEGSRASAVSSAASTSTAATSVNNDYETYRPAAMSSLPPAMNNQAAQASLGQGAGRPSIQARMKTLPRLASYTLAPRASRASNDDGNGLSRVDTRDSIDHTGREYDTSTSMSGTDTEHDPSESETDDDEDDDDEEHDEVDVQGGAAAMRTNLQRPALPTLASRSGGLNRMGSFSPTPGGAGGSRTPFAISPNSNPFQFQGWTTFASSTPTPGPLRTARPQPGDNAADGSYFDARPSSSYPKVGGNNATPLQTPRGDAGTPGNSASPASRIRSPGSISPMPGSSAVSPPSSLSRLSVHSRQSSSGSPLKGNPAPRSPIVTTSGQSFPASAIPSYPGMPTTSTSTSTSTAVPSERPAFYQRQSRSLVDLSRSLDPEPVAIVAPVPPKALSRPPSSGGPAAAITGSEASSAVDSVVEEGEQQPSPTLGEEEEEDDAVQPVQVDQVAATANERSTVSRRASMPEMRIEPPMYQADDDVFVQWRKNGPIPIAREDEGVEDLPTYSCDVHIEGYVPRKMEFLKPGVQSKDRRWKRQYVILHGTSIKVYKADPRVKAVPGDEAPAPTPGIHKENYRPTYPTSGGKGSANGLASSSASSAAGSSSSLPTGGAGSRNRAATASSMSSATSSAGGQDSEKALAWNRATQEVVAQRKFDPDIPVHVHVNEEQEHGLASLQHKPSALLAKAGENRCIRHYTLQGAESGLAADYLKRKHVIRIRAEGEQYLIQAKDDRAVIDWIEALQAATNTSLDLDVRPLPKFITLPRRRRRRPRPADPNAPAGTAAAAGTPAAVAAAAAAGRTATPPSQAGTTARSDAMNNMLAEEQDNYMRPSTTALA